ncbi:MAG: MFS transporter [Bacteroidales bacterium]|nr:MFS transporter [Bacteroidales bacterium]
MTQKSNIKVVIAAQVGIFFFGVVFFVLGTILNALGLTAAQSSTLASSLPLGVLIGSLVFGPIIDRYGYKILLVGAAAMGVVGLEILAFTNSFGAMVAAILLIGTCGGMLNGSTSALISDSSEGKARTSNLFVLGLVYCIGAIVITLIMTICYEKVDYHKILMIMGFLMAAAMLYFIAIKFPEAKCKQGISFKSVINMIKEPTLLIFSFALAFQSALEALAATWTSKYLEDIGYVGKMALVASIFIPVGLAISRASLIVISKKASSKTIVLTSMAIAVAGIICLFTANGAAMTIIGTTLIGMGLAATFPATFGILGEKYSEMSGTAFSFALTIALIGNTLINKLVGTLGTGSLLYVMLGSILLLVVLFLIGCSTIRPEKAIKK